MENSEHNKHMEIDKETEVKVTDLPDMSIHSRDWYARSSHTLLPWQRSFNQRSWRLTSVAGTLPLGLVAMLLIYGSLYRVITPSSLSDKTDYHITPTVHHHYIYLDRPVAKYAGHLDSVLIVAWSPDGTRIASGGSDWRIHVWEANTEKLLLIYSGHTEVVSTIAWSPDSTRIASGSYDTTLQVWNANNGARILTYYDHPDTVYSVAWSPDSTRIVSGSYDGMDQMWDASSGEALFAYRGGGLFVAWSPTGNLIASGGKMES
jgi:WD40 repeat protein